ncbi:STAS domain-containing protein [Streptomyces sp. DSM 41987]|uniref:STAS domain-containing protein n=1 Tax=Streptomyces TaxID=1883 RepID=UPI00361C139D
MPLRTRGVRLRGHADIDLTAVSFCDVSGLNLFLAVSQYATAAGKQLRLSHPTSGVTPGRQQPSAAWSGGFRKEHSPYL